MGNYNLTRFVEELLEEHQSDPPSFSVHLYPDYWTLNNGSKFLYNNQVASLLDDIRAQRMPNDFLELFDAAKLPFYDGCMVVELLDYRPPKGKDPVLEKPEKTRVVLTPNQETFWTDLCLLNQKAGSAWTDRDALEVEARILMATAPPLCLDPNPHLTRIANNILRVSVPTTPASLKRKAAAMEMEEEDAERARRAKIMQFMNPKINRSTAPSYRILDTLQRIKQQKLSQPQVPPPQQPPAPAPSVPLTNSSSSNGVTDPSSASFGGVAPNRISAQIPSSVPTPPIPVATPISDPKKKPLRQDSAQSPVLPRPASTVPPAIPMQMQPPYQHGRTTPVSTTPTQSSRPPSALGTVSALPPAEPEKRPPSSLQQRNPTPLHHPPQSQSQPQAQPQPVTQQPSQPTLAAQPSRPQSQPQQPLQPAQQHVNPFQVAVPPTNYHATPPAGKKKVAIPTTQLPTQAQQYMYQQYAYQQVARNQAQNPNPTPSPAPQATIAASNQPTAQRNSPMVANQAVVSRSPMPNSVQQSTMAHTQQQGFNYTYPGQYNPAATAGHLRPMTAGLPHPQALPPHPATAQAGQGAQDQGHVQQMVPQYSMYYPQMGMNMNMAMPQGRMLWGQMPGMGRGMPIANAQHMATHPQQMPLGTNKAIPGGMQGS